MVWVGCGLDMVWGSLRTQQIPPLRCGMEMQKVARGMCAFPPIAKCAMDGAPGSAQDDKFMGKSVSCIPCICRYGLRLWFGAYPSETQIAFGNDNKNGGCCGDWIRDLPHIPVFRVYPWSLGEWPLTRI